MSQRDSDGTVMLFGRRVSAYSSVYLLPQDMAEHERLKRTTQLLEGSFAEFYSRFHNFIKKRKSISNYRIQCLDLGCGTGQWLFNSARQYPDVIFAGIDLVPTLPVAITNQLPSNIYYTMHDMNLGLSGYYNQYDYVQSHFLAAGIRTFNSYIAEIYEILRPSGLMTLVELDLQAYQAPNVNSPHPKTTAVANYFGTVERASMNRGADISSAKYLKLVVERQGRFVDIEQTDRWIPVVPFPGPDYDEELVQAKALMPLFNSMISAFQPLLSTYIASEKIAELEDNARAELVGKNNPLYIRISTLSARKPPM